LKRIVFVLSVAMVKAALVLATSVPALAAKPCFTSETDGFCYGSHKACDANTDKGDRCIATH
jgi:hypothetical protein